MQVSYKKLWKLLIDRNMTRTELRLKAGISSVSLAKLGKDEGMTTNVLVKICSTLKCDIEVLEAQTDGMLKEILSFGK